MKKTSTLTMITAFSVLLCIAVTCKNGNNSDDPPHKQLTLLTPLGGAGVQYAVGDSVTIMWTVDNTIPGCQPIASVAVMYSTDGGATFPFGIRNTSFPTDTTSYRWGVENIHVSNQFKIKIYDYNDASNASDQSASFIIVP